jgi:hypothetical protein
MLSKMQVQNFHENSLCFKKKVICLKHSRKTCGHVVLLFQFFFKSNFFKYIFHKKGSMCSKYSKNTNTYTLLNFDTQTSLSTIIILNL